MQKMEAVDSLKKFVPITSLGVVTRKRTVFIFLIVRLFHSFLQSLCSPFLFGQTNVCLFCTAVNRWPFSQHPACIGVTHCVLTLHFYPETGNNILLRNTGIHLYLSVLQHTHIMWEFVTVHTGNRIGNLRVNVAL